MWIESHTSLYEHRKTRKAARLLCESVPTVMGHLHCLWHWALTHAEDGDLSELEADEIAFGAKWDGDPQEFIEALLGCGKGTGAGFLERAGGDLRLHDWADYAGKLMARREASRERAQASRERARTLRAGAAIQHTTVPNQTKPLLQRQAAAAVGVRDSQETFTEPERLRAAREVLDRRRDKDPGWNPATTIARWLRGVVLKLQDEDEIRELLESADERARPPPPDPTKAWRMEQQAHREQVEQERAEDAAEAAKGAP